MIRLFQFLIHGCWHQWETREHVILESTFARGSRVKLQCKRCGRWTKQDLI